MNMQCIYREETRRNTNLDQINIIYRMTIDDCKITHLEAYLSTSHFYIHKSMPLCSFAMSASRSVRSSFFFLWGWAGIKYKK